MEVEAVIAQFRSIIAFLAHWSLGVAGPLFLSPIWLLKGAAFTVLTFRVFVPEVAFAGWRQDSNEAEEVMRDI